MSSYFLAALVAKLGARSDLGSALGALGLWRERSAALVAELPALGFCATCRAVYDHRRVEVYTLGLIACTQFFGGLLDSNFGLLGGHFALENRRALRAKAALGIPADFAANPLTASLALHEEGLDFGHGLCQRTIVRRAADGILDFVSAGGGATEHAAENLACTTQHSSGNSGGIRLPARHIAIAAAFAEKLELKTVLRGDVLEVVCKLDSCHYHPLLSLRLRY